MAWPQGRSALASRAPGRALAGSAAILNFESDKETLTLLRFSVTSYVQRQAPCYDAVNNQLHDVVLGQGGVESHVVDGENFVADAQLTNIRRAAWNRKWSRTVQGTCKETPHRGWKLSWSFASGFTSCRSLPTLGRSTLCSNRQSRGIGLFEYYRALPLKTCRNPTPFVRCFSARRMAGTYTFTVYAYVEIPEISPRQ